MAAKIFMLCTIYTVAYKVAIHRVDYYNRIGVFTRYIKTLLIKNSELACPREDNYLSKLSEPLN